LFIGFVCIFGDWGLGIGDWGLGPIPNPQSPIPNPHLKYINPILPIFTNWMNTMDYILREKLKE